MEGNVFGDAITEGSREERATKAYNDPNAGGKLDAVNEYLRKEKEAFGVGDSTLCRFYNATGETITFDTYNNWVGHVYDSYPQRVQNGQWGGFLHQKTPIIPSGSSGAVVYRGKYNDTDTCVQLLAWEVPLIGANHSYCDIKEDDGSSFNWDSIKNNLEASGSVHNVSWNGMFTAVKIEGGTSPFWEGVLATDADAKAKFEAGESVSVAV